jgi:hypothetical protein
MPLPPYSANRGRFRSSAQSVAAVNRKTVSAGSFHQSSCCDSLRDVFLLIRRYAAGADRLASGGLALARILIRAGRNIEPVRVFLILLLIGPHRRVSAKRLKPSLKAVAFSGTDKRSVRTAWRARHCRDRISRSSPPWLLGLENRNFLHRTCRGALATLGAADASPASPARRGPCVKRPAHIPASRPRSKPAAPCRTSSETPSGCRSPES